MPSDRHDTTGPTAAYLAGLKAAEEECVARANMHKAQTLGLPSYHDKSSYLADALEAMQCACAIKYIREDASREMENAE